MVEPDAAFPRRAVLAAALATPLAAVAGCTDRPGGAGGRPRGSVGGEGGTSPTVDPDDGLRAEAAAEVGALARRYAAALAAAPQLTPVLRPLARHVDQHLAALGSGPRSHEPSATTAPVPAREAAGQVRRGLREAERLAARRRRDQAVRAHDPALARLLAAIGACSDAHVVLLSRPA